MVSIENPRFPASRLPLWSIRYFKKMYEIHNIQSQWRKGIEWLDSNLDGSLAINSLVRDYAMSIRWNERTDIPGASNLTLLCTYVANKC